MKAAELADSPNSNRRGREAEPAVPLDDRITGVLLFARSGCAGARESSSIRLMDWSFTMKALPLVGVLLLVLGVLSFVVPIPHSENHGVKIGDAKISVETQSSDKLPPAAGIVLLAGGVVALVLGLRKT
jgi:hypothetical protein